MEIRYINLTNKSNHVAEGTLNKKLLEVYSQYLVEYLSLSLLHVNKYVLL